MVAWFCQEAIPFNILSLEPSLALSPLPTAISTARLAILDRISINSVFPQSSFYYTKHLKFHLKRSSLMQFMWLATILVKGPLQ